MANITITDEDIMIYNQKFEKKIEVNYLVEENYLLKELNNLSEESKTNINNLWENSPFKYVNEMKPDPKGSWGEKFIVQILKLHTDFSVEWDGNSNTSNEDGIYDVKINKKRGEIKTATTGYDYKKNTLTNKFQHDNIYEECVWDNLIFLDIEPKGFYITVIKHSHMVFNEIKHPIFKTQSTRHLSAWKFDTSKLSLQRGIEGGITIYVDIYKNNRKEITDFLVRHLK